MLLFSSDAAIATDNGDVCTIPNEDAIDAIRNAKMNNFLFMLALLFGSLYCFWNYIMWIEVSFR